MIRSRCTLDAAAGSCCFLLVVVLAVVAMLVVVPPFDLWSPLTLVLRRWRFLFCRARWEGATHGLPPGVERPGWQRSAEGGSG